MPFRFILLPESNGHRFYRRYPFELQETGVSLSSDEVTSPGGNMAPSKNSPCFHSNTTNFH